MSWDVTFFRFRQRYTTIDQIADDEQPLCLGALDEIQAAVSAVFPGTDWTKPRWGRFAGEPGSIEFSVWKTDPIQSLSLHVRAGDPIVEGILRLRERMDCQAIDLTDGCFLELSDDPLRGLRRWRQVRDCVVGQVGRR
jgi:hypothetical protein